MGKIIFAGLHIEHRWRCSNENYINFEDTNYWKDLTFQKFPHPPRFKKRLKRTQFTSSAPPSASPFEKKWECKISDWPQYIYKKHIQDTKHAHTNQEFEHNELQNCKINHWKRFVVLNHFIFALTCCFLITHVISCASICLVLIHNWLLMKPSRSILNVAYLFHDSTTSSLTKPSRPMQPLKTHHTQSKVQTLYVQNPHNINPKPWWPKTSKHRFSILNSPNKKLLLQAWQCQ